VTARVLVRAGLALALLAAGCADGPRLGEGKLLQPLAVSAMAEQKELPPPSAADLAAAAHPYHIGPFDKLDIKVLNFPDLGGSLQVDVGGGLAMPLIGEVEASGRTPAELAGEIRTKLMSYVRVPQVTVNLAENNSQFYTIDGQVTQPGSYPVTGDMTLMRAIAGAKGAGEFARLNDVVVFRTVDGRPLAALYDLNAIRHGVYADPRIYANDKIVVGDSKARRMFQQFVQVAPLLTTPLILALERFR
jgi:polysaccharide export outer membrane protein